MPGKNNDIALFSLAMVPGVANYFETMIGKSFLTRSRVRLRSAKVKTFFTDKYAEFFPNISLLSVNFFIGIVLGHGSTTKCRTIFK